MPQKIETYDYIIAGAGSAGCVLAARLSENPHTRVLLLEAGGADDAREVRIPAAFSKLFKTPFDWDYSTEEEPHLNGRRLYWPRGKMLGGSSSMNAMIYVRGNHRDYDHWEELGNAGWGFRDVLPYFKKSEKQERGASQYHGSGGPLSVSDLRYVNPLTRVFLAAAQEIGISANPDFNGAIQDGAGLNQVTQKNGRRHSAADAYLRPALRRPNLRVATRAHATRVLMVKDRATGVAYLRDGVPEEARATGEVILAAGTIHSAQLLLLTGIGPAEELKRAGVAPLHDLPGVGKNLQDHPMVSVGYLCKQAASQPSKRRDAAEFLALPAIQTRPAGFERGGGGNFLPHARWIAGPRFAITFWPGLLPESRAGKASGACVWIRADADNTRKSRDRDAAVCGSGGACGYPCKLPFNR